MPKNPMFLDKAVLRDGGSLETQAGTEIISVDSSGVPSIKADIQEALTQGSIYIGNASGVTSELAVGTSGQVLKSNGTTLVYGESGFDSGDTITSTDPGSEGAVLNFFHDSASPAAQDIVAGIKGYGNDDGGNKTLYGQIGIIAGSVADGSELGAVVLYPAGADGSFDTTPNFMVTRDSMTLTREDEGGSGMSFRFNHVTTTPAAYDTIASTAYSSVNGGSSVTYGEVFTQIEDPTGGSEEGLFAWKVITGGAMASNSYTMQLTGTDLSLTREDDGVAGMTMKLVQRSATPASGDVVGGMSFIGNNSVSTTPTTEYAGIGGGIVDTTDGSEEGFWGVKVMTGGAATSVLDVSGEDVSLSRPLRLKQAEQALSGAGAVDVTSQTTNWDCNGAVAGTLADGEEGQRKFIYCGAYTGNGTLTPDNLLGFATIAFTAVGQSVLLEFRGTNWVIVGDTPCTLA